MLIMNPTWAVSVLCLANSTKILVTDTVMGEDLLKARLPAFPRHRLSLVSLCEGLALWHGSPLRVAVSADEDARASFDRVLYGDDIVEPQSPLVMLETRPPRKRTRRRGDERGLGDFRQLRLPEHDR